MGGEEKEGGGRIKGYTKKSPRGKLKSLLLDPMSLSQAIPKIPLVLHELLHPQLGHLGVCCTGSLKRGIRCFKAKVTGRGEGERRGEEENKKGAGRGNWGKVTEG
jgi:hypothetical protein